MNVCLAEWQSEFPYLKQLMCFFFSWFSFILYQLLCSRFLIRDFHLFHFLLLLPFAFAFAFTFLSNQVCACVWVSVYLCVPVHWHTWQNISTYVVTTFNCNFWCMFLVFRSLFHSVHSPIYFAFVTAVVVVGFFFHFPNFIIIPMVFCLLFSRRRVHIRLGQIFYQHRT